MANQANQLDQGQLESAAQRLRDSFVAHPDSPDADSLAILVHACASPHEATATLAAKLLISHVVEDLSDRFDPSLVDCYVAMFTEALAACQPIWSRDFLRNRYQQLRAGSPPLSALAVEQIFVLSRITLGADIAVTSVFLDALRKRYPEARISLIGPSKNFELFAGDPGISHWPLDYPRGGTLPQRMAVAGQLSGLGDQPGTLVVDPDSRITQLGLLPIAPSTRTLFFESRTADAESTRTLSEIASRFCFLRLGVPDAVPFLALPASLVQAASTLKSLSTLAPVTVSFGVGGNLAKRVGHRFEGGLLQTLAATGRPIWLDAGAGGAEADWVSAAAAALPSSQVHILHGSFASFCAHIANSALYVGYDSAGQHAASALGVPGITVFRGAVSQRMMDRWKPRGPGSRVIAVTSDSDESTLLDVLRAHLKECLAGSG